MQHNLEVSARDIKSLNRNLKETKEIKEKMEKLHHKEAADSKSFQAKLEKEIANLKEKCQTLNSQLAKKSVPKIQSLDKRDPLFITLNTQTGSQPLQNKYVFSNTNLSGKGSYLYLISPIDPHLSPEPSKRKKISKLKPAIILSDKHLTKKSPFSSKFFKRFSCKFFRSEEK